MKKLDLDDRYGRLAVLSYVPEKRQYLCLCDCGALTHVYAHNLRSGMTTSCGCYRRQRQSEANTVHGLSNDPLYLTWRRMMDRCYNPKNGRFSSYGGRGIVVDEKWHSAKQFINDNHGKKTSGHSLDRKDNNGPYSLENCRWVDASTQQRNRRTNRYLTLNGETLLLIDWAKRIGMPQHSISTRIKRGWSVEDALTTPPLIRR